jgi:diacylglycerol kinase family enzyme
VLSGIKALQKRKSTLFRLTLDNQVVEKRGLACMVANASSAGIPGLKLSHKIQIDDGILDIIIIDFDHLPLLISAATSALITGEKSIETALTHLQARQINIETDPPEPVSVDGDIIGETPIEIEILPHSLNLLTPYKKLNSHH